MHKIAWDYKNGQQMNTDPVYFNPAGGGDYKSLNAMVRDLINDKIPVQYRNDLRLVVLAGGGGTVPPVSVCRPATEKIAAMLLSDSVSSRVAYVPPFMLGNRLVVTTPSNLYIYTQRNTH